MFFSGCIGHFQAFVIDRSTQIGCGMTKFIDRNWKSYLLTCNYASVGIYGYKVYQTGVTASGCTTGSNPEYPGLCSSSEPIDPNKY